MSRGLYIAKRNLQNKNKLSSLHEMLIKISYFLYK